MPGWREVQIKLGFAEPPSAMERATEHVRRNPTIDRLKTTLGLQPKTELQELQDSMCPRLTYEQVRPRRACPARA
jgi:hypothetical protein